MNAGYRRGVGYSDADDKADLAATLGAIVPSAREVWRMLQAAGGYPVQVLLLPPDYVQHRGRTDARIASALGGGSRATC